MCPQKPVFQVLVRWYPGFREKNLKTVLGTSFPHQKGYIHFCHPRIHSLKNGYATAPALKKNFAIILENIVFFVLFFFFSKKLLNEKYSKRPCLQKNVILIFVTRRPHPLKTVMSFHKWVSCSFL